MNFIKSLHMDSPQPLDVSPQKCFLSVDWYGGQMAFLEITTAPLVNTVTVSLLHLLRDHW